VYTAPLFNVKLKRFKKHFKGWGPNILGHGKKMKNSCRMSWWIWGVLEENTNLCPKQLRRESDIQLILMEMHASEELYWHQRSNERWLLQGNNNTYFPP
jgi:hypothetical protein